MYENLGWIIAGCVVISVGFGWWVTWYLRDVFQDQYECLHQQHRYHMMLADKMRREVDRYEESKK